MHTLLYNTIFSPEKQLIFRLHILKNQKIYSYFFVSKGMFFSRIIYFPCNLCYTGFDIKISPEESL